MTRWEAAEVAAPWAVVAVEVQVAALRRTGPTSLGHQSWPTVRHFGRCLAVGRCGCRRRRFRSLQRSAVCPGRGCAEGRRRREDAGSGLEWPGSESPINWTRLPRASCCARSLACAETLGRPKLRRVDPDQADALAPPVREAHIDRVAVDNVLHHSRLDELALVSARGSRRRTQSRKDKECTKEVEPRPQVDPSPE